MIRRPAEFSSSTTIKTDVAVVGAGPIGIVTALELARSGVQVALIESGLERTIENKTVTYDFERLMPGSTKVSTSKFADHIIENMGAGVLSAV